MQRAPHVCFVAPAAYPALVADASHQVVGGAEVQQVLLAQALARRGYQITMICMDFGQPEEQEVDGIRIVRSYGSDEGLPAVRFIVPRMTRTWACMKLVEADIYYQMTAGTLTGVVAAYCRWSGKSSVFAVAGRPMIRHRRERWFYNYGLRNVSRILVQNEAQQAEIMASVGRDATLVPGLCRRLDERTHMVRDSVVWIGTIRSVKRPDIFLQLAERMPQLSFKMIGGAAAEERNLYPELEARARKLPNVRFLGFVTDYQLRGIMSTAAVLVNTSESEGFPDTFLQAWADAVPSVSFVDCGARLDGRAVGIQVTTLAEMHGMVEKLMSSEERRTQEGLLCRRYVERHHSEETVLDLYESVFSELLGRDLRTERQARY